MILAAMLFLFFSDHAIAVSAAKPATIKPADVLSFDATVIEGERKTPSIFLEVDVDKYSDIDSILLNRENFNNFHRADENERTLVFDHN